MRDKVQIRKAGVLAAVLIGALSLGGIALAQEGAPTEVFTQSGHGAPGPLDAGYGQDCANGLSTHVIGVGDVGWAEVALRSRGLILVDYGAWDAKTEIDVDETPDEIVITFDTGTETTELRIGHVDGAIVTSQRVVSATGSVSPPIEGAIADDGHQQPDDEGAMSSEADASEEGGGSEPEGSSDTSPWLEFLIEAAVTADSA